MAKLDLNDIYNVLFETYGPQQWWPGETPIETMVGAVLTQNTNWSNVEKAIHNLKSGQMLSVERIQELSHEELAELIHPSGYYNIKAKRLKNLVQWFWEHYNGDFEALGEFSVDRLREELLGINGVGRETADSIILYALNKPTFVVDAYTFRILYRHGLIDDDCDYEQLKEYCEMQLAEDVQLYNEFHALIVKVGKIHCKSKPKCSGCPLDPYEKVFSSCATWD